MIEWWNAMPVFQQVLAAIGIVSVLLLVVQLIISLVSAASGGVGDMDAQSDFDFDGVVPDMDGGFDIDSADVPDGDIGRDADTGSPGKQASPGEPSSGLKLFTMQGIIAFLSIFSWTALLMIKAGMHMVPALVIAAVLGFIAMALMAAAMRAMLKLQYDGATDIRNALGTVGTVYLTIPAKRSHPGKVSLMLQGNLRELEAVTDDTKPIPTGSQVFVYGISGKNTLLVKKK